MYVLLGWLRRKCDTETDWAEKRLSIHGFGLILGLIGHLIYATKMSWDSVVMVACVSDDKKSRSVREYQVEISILPIDIP